MKFFKIIFFIIFMFFNLSAEDNKTTQVLILDLEQIKPSKDDNVSVDLIVEAKEKILNQILFNLKSENLAEISLDTKRVSFLTQRVILNQERGNEIAIARDKIEILYHNLNADFYKFLSNIQTAREKFLSKKEMEKIIKNYIDILNSLTFTKESEIYQKYRNDTSLSIIIDLNQNYEKLINIKKIYNEVANYLLLNSKEIEQKNLIISNLNIERVSAMLNGSYFAKELNIYLNHYFSLNFGKLVIALISMLAILLLIKLIPLILYITEKNLNSKKDASNIKIHYFLKDSLTIPIKLFLFVFAIEVAVRIASTSPEKIERFIFFVHHFYLVLIGIVVYNFINNAIIYFAESIFDTSSNIKKELINFMVKFLKVIIIIIIVLIILKEMGYNITAIIASLGVGGIAIALAAKDTLSNLFASLSIMLDDVFSQGDLIETEKVKGTVVEIGIRSSTIRTFDNALVTVANSYLAEASILNWSKRKIGRQIKFTISLTYQSEPEKIKKAINEIYEMLVLHPEIADDKSIVENVKSSKILSKDDLMGVKNNIKVLLDNLSPYSMDILVYCFSKSVVWDDWLKTKEDILYKVLEIIKSNNLEFAYPTQKHYITMD